jgi:hypothetical protein
VSREEYGEVGATQAAQSAASSRRAVLRARPTGEQHTAHHTYPSFKCVVVYLCLTEGGGKNLDPSKTGDTPTAVAQHDPPATKAIGRRAEGANHQRCREREPRSEENEKNTNHKKKKNLPQNADFYSVDCLDSHRTEKLLRCSDCEQQPEMAGRKSRKNNPANDTSPHSPQTTAPHITTHNHTQPHTTTHPHTHNPSSQSRALRAPALRNRAHSQVHPPTARVEISRIIQRRGCSRGKAVRQRDISMGACTSRDVDEDEAGQQSRAASKVIDRALRSVGFC